jgi:transcriptional repressor NrdR
LNCKFCGEPESKVVDSRPTDEGNVIRRRRECVACGKRFTTYEKVENVPLLVIKKDGRREPFDPDKITAGVIKACEKRPVTIKEVEALVEDIEKQVYNSLVQEISSHEIGEMVMQRLKSLDEVAYVRFASVYRQFKDINTFMKELNKLLKEK